MRKIRLSTHARKAYERLARSDRRLFLRVDRALDRIAGEPEAGNRGEFWVLVLDIAKRGRMYR